MIELCGILAFRGDEYPIILGNQEHRVSILSYTVNYVSTAKTVRDISRDVYCRVSRSAL